MDVYTSFFRPSTSKDLKTCQITVYFTGLSWIFGLFFKSKPKHNFKNIVFLKNRNFLVEHCDQLNSFLVISNWVNHDSTVLFKKKFVSDFKFTANLQGTYRDLPYTPYSETCIRLFIINISHQSDTFVTTDETTLTYYHPKSIVYIRVHSWYWHSMGLDKCIVLCAASLALCYKNLQCRTPRFYLLVGKIPWRGKEQPPPVLLVGKSQWQESLVV